MMTSIGGLRLRLDTEKGTLKGTSDTIRRFWMYHRSFYVLLVPQSKPNLMSLTRGCISGIHHCILVSRSNGTGRGNDVSLL